jgi:hypothetical protein
MLSAIPLHPWLSQLHPLNISISALQVNISLFNVKHIYSGTHSVGQPSWIKVPCYFLVVNTLSAMLLCFYFLSLLSCFPTSMYRLYQKKKKIETWILLTTPVPKSLGQMGHQLVGLHGRQTRPKIIKWHSLNCRARNSSASAYRQPTESSTCGCARDQNLLNLAMGGWIAGRWQS